MSQAQQQSETRPADTSPISYKPWYLYYVLGVLFFGYVINSMDRAVLNVLLESIKLEFKISDTMAGFLGGITFAAFYSIMGIPIAAIADRNNRVNVLSISIALWSIMTALCGLASQFIYLLLARVGTAIGEAGGTPPSHSLLSDYFPRHRRATAISIYMMGVPIGQALGQYSGGWLNQYLDWRMAFVLVGLPGVLVALLAKTTVREPLRGYSDLNRTTLSEPVPPIWEVFKHLWRIKAFRYLCIANGLHSFVWYGGSSWNNSFFIRTHNMSFGDAATLLMSISLISCIGTYGGGVLADKLSVRFNDKRWYLLLPAIATFGMIPFQFSSYLAADKLMVILSFYIMMILASVFFGPTYAMAQALSPTHMRARAASIVLFVQTMLGYGLGPIVVGMLSDWLMPTQDKQSLAWGLVIVGLANIGAAWYYYQGSRTLAAELDSAVGLSTTK